VLVTAYGPDPAAGATISAEEMMSKRRHTKLVREGAYAAEVEVELIDADRGWALTRRQPTLVASTRCEKPSDEACLRGIAARTCLPAYAALGMMTGEQAHPADAAAPRR
jgi:hypothetical protein